MQNTCKPYKHEHHVAALDSLLQLHPVNERKREGLGLREMMQKKKLGGLHFTAQLATPRAKSRAREGKQESGLARLPFPLPSLSCVCPCIHTDPKLYQMSLQEWKPPSACDEEFKKFWKIFIEVDQTFSASEVEVNVVRPKWERLPKGSLALHNSNITLLECHG